MTVQVKRLTSLRLVATHTDDNVLWFLRGARKVVVDDALRSLSIARLRVESSARVVRDHAVTTTNGVLHVPPWVILGGRLDIPDITRVSRQLPALERLCDGIPVADRSTGGVHEPSALRIH